MSEQPEVGTHIILLKDGKVLLGKRKKKIGRGEWELPGGHLKFQEKLEDCLIRECKEELGIKVKVGDLVSVSTNMIGENHYVILTFLADSFEGRPKLREPEIHETWKWFDLDNLPKPLFTPTKFALEDFKAGKVYQKREELS